MGFTFNKSALMITNIYYTGSSFQISNNEPQNPLVNHDEISDSDLNSDQPYSVDNNVLKYNVINSEASDSSYQSAVSILYQHENYPLNNTNFDQSNTLHMELTEGFIDSSCTCLHGYESIFSEEKEFKEMVSPLANNKNNHDQLSPVAFSDQLLINKNCKLLNPANVNLVDNIESFEQQTPVTMMATTIINKQEYQDVSTDQKGEEFTKRICGVGNNGMLVITIGSKEIIDQNRLGKTDHINSSNEEQIKISKFSRTTFVFLPINIFFRELWYSSEFLSIFISVDCSKVVNITIRRYFYSQTGVIWKLVKNRLFDGDKSVTK
ncbi:unnamed protein product [Schistosoma curassoni]|uniref:Uncharacterized protein n=1 Tax=Schistosoma curassoni TaxID=6186 RepID=A0A183KY77_9TREM|nr:unnamed protein product [Schistosoma curassoni]